MAHRSPYDVLGVAHDASQAEIRSAYRCLAMVHHPDRPTGSAEEFAVIAAAYARVSTPARRAASDGAQPEDRPARPAPAAPDLSHVAATPEDLDARWEALVSDLSGLDVPRRSRWWWSR